MPLILDSPTNSAAASTVSLDLGRHADVEEERRRVYHEADVVIVGAGILGSALAVAFGNQGRSVILLEKSLKEPDRIVGELLQPGGVEALTRLGLRHCLEDIDAIRVKGYGVIYHGELVRIPYPVNAVTQPKEKNEKAKRPEGRSFHHGRFVSQLRAAALSHRNVSVFETEATSIITSTDSPQVLGVETLTRKTQRDVFFGDLTVICDGYASKFRKAYSRHTPLAKSKFWGMELIDCPLPVSEYGTVVLGDDAPVLLYQIGTHETRVLVDVPDGTPTASLAAGGVKSHLEKVVLPSLPEMVRPSFKAALEKGNLRSMPNSFLPPVTNITPGLALLGDALNMRHPLTGGGMTVALNDVVLLSKLLDPAIVPDLGSTKLVLKQMRAFHWQRKNLTGVINILAQALYSLFAANNVYLKYLQKGCFQYFQRGGNCVDGPVGLLAGIIRQPMVLFYHFYSVALLSMWVLIQEAGWWKLPVSLVMSVMVLWEACVVLLPYIWAEFQT